MRKYWLSLVALSILVCIQPGMISAQSNPQMNDPGKEVRSIFAAKCAGCHGSDLAKPRGRFGYVLDLNRIAANPEMVVPRYPEESELWELVRRDEMPPTDSPHGPLAPSQKETIRAWIEAGAPKSAGISNESSASSVTSESVPLPMEIISIERILRWMGKFHLLLLHFPIALIIVAGVGEVWSIMQRNRTPSEIVRFCLWLGALAAIPTAILGWIFAADGNGASSPQLLALHRWLGTIAALWLIITVACVEWDSWRGQRSLRVRLLLWSGVIIIALTAHIGGLLDRGEDFFAY